MLHTERFVDEFVPTLGVGLRYMIDRSALWLQFIPAALGSLWASGISSATANDGTGARMVHC